jgi:hypothetical protein
LALIAVFVIVRNLSMTSTRVGPIGNPNLVPTDQSIVGDQFTGTMKGSDGDWIFMTYGKYPETRKLEFMDNSVCIVKQEKGPCFALKVYFGKGNTSSSGGGDNVEIIGERTNTGLLVKSLTLKENFILNGTLSKNGNAYSIQNSAAGTIPLAFDEESICKMDDTDISRCDLSEVKNGMSVFVHGLFYKNSVFVRNMVVTTQTAPSTQPTPNY